MSRLKPGLIDGGSEFVFNRKSGKKRKAPLYNRTIGERQPANPAVASLVMDAKVSSPDGRSQWFWIRLSNGDLVLATYPQGDTYFMTELDRNRP